jgi:hypothetical protein
MKDWAEMMAIVRVRMAAEPAATASLAPDHQFVHGTLAYMTANANRYASDGTRALLHQGHTSSFIKAMTQQV